MLARDNEEFEMYEEFDRMRYEEEKQIYQNFQYGTNYRLIPEDEVPDHVKIKEEKKKKVLGKRRNYRELYNVIPDIDELSEDERRSKKRASNRSRRKRQSRARRNGAKKGVRGARGANLKRKKTAANGKQSDLKSGAAEEDAEAPKKEEEKDDIFVDSDD